ncbi:YqgU-like beta propeller domain-containing protein [Alkalihalobacterium elongatum]|uniref:YqgU-like beta propeller domain-containing protein n=1 Tax=Alkalihalobacterium elongatum TaxID=2675466 RepID=UPI001C1FC84D|nr:hypothetical protein [Alkalihalobacterium elongatum]
MKSKSLFFVITFLIVFIVGCTTKDKVRIDQPQKNLNLIQKELNLLIETKFETPLQINPYSFVEISEWYDSQTILLLKDENAVSYIDKINLNTGEISEFFQSEEPIFSVEANYDHSYFAIQTSTYDLTAPLYFINKEGEVVYKLSEIGEDFSLFWNQYDRDELIIISFLPDWEFDVYRLNLKDGRLVQLDLEKMYFQWLNEDEVAFLEWSSFAPSFFAPIYKYNLETNHTEEILEEVIAFVTFGENILVAISVDSLDAEMSLYQFYKNNNPIGELQIPTLNTYSEQWWIPFHQYDSSEHLFYFLRPLYSGDFFSYDAPFELTQFNVETGTEQKILDLELQAPIKLSPNGNWMLYGNQYEWLIDLTNKEVHSLIE